MKVEVVCKNDDIKKLIPIDPLPYKVAIEKAFDRIDNNDIISSWKDSYQW